MINENKDISEKRFESKPAENEIVESKPNNRELVENKIGKNVGNRRLKKRYIGKHYKEKSGGKHYREFDLPGLSKYLKYLKNKLFEKMKNTELTQNPEIDAQ